MTQFHSSGFNIEDLEFHIMQPWLDWKHMCCFTLFNFKKIIWKRGREKWESYIYLFTSQTTHNIWTWAMLKLRAGTSIWVSHVSGGSSTIWKHHLLPSRRHFSKKMELGVLTALGHRNCVPHTCSDYIYPWKPLHGIQGLHDSFLAILWCGMVKGLMIHLMFDPQKPHSERKEENRDCWEYFCCLQQH